MGKSSGGLFSERPAIFRGLLHLLDLGHNRHCQSLSSTATTTLFNKYNAKEDLKQIKGNQRSLWDRMKEIGACWYIVFKQLEEIS